MITSEIGDLWRRNTTEAAFLGCLINFLLYAFKTLLSIWLYRLDREDIQWQLKESLLWMNYGVFLYARTFHWSLWRLLFSQRLLSLLSNLGPWALFKHFDNKLRWIWFEVCKPAWLNTFLCTIGSNSFPENIVKNGMCVYLTWVITDINKNK